MLTLFEIAEALDIDISQLTDFNSGKPTHSRRSSINFFGRYSRFFVYINQHISGITGFLKGVLEVTSRSEDSNEDTLFILVKSPQWMRNTAKGILLSVSNTYGCPSSSMIMFTTEAAVSGENLKEDLNITKDEIIEFAKKTNIVAPF